jgi:hypothetical protein
MSNAEVTNFIRTNFRSVWSLELLLFLRRNKERAWTRAEMVTGLRASDSIVHQSVDQLAAAGLVATEEDGSARYSPAAADLDRQVADVEAYYAKSPDAVRRMIVMSAQGGLAAFADAFRLRRD